MFNRGQDGKTSSFRAVIVAVLVFCLLGASLTVATPASSAPTGPVVLIPVDGGADYFARWSNSLPSDPDFYPVSVWAESFENPAADAAAYKALGINGFVYLWNGLTPAIDSALRANDQWTFAHPPADQVPRGPSPLKGYAWFDEPEVQNVCPRVSPTWVRLLCTGFSDHTPASSVQAMSDAVRAMDPTRPTFGQFTKQIPLGTTMDDHTRKEYVDAVDIVSFDWYALTDQIDTGPIWKQADAVRNTRALTNYSKPVWAFIETSEIFVNAIAHPTPQQITAEAWNAIIGGARGIEYFNHNFYPGKETEHLLIDPDYAATSAAVSATNARIAALAPVLNAPFASNLVAVQSGTVNHMAKAYNDAYYLFVAPRTNNTQTVKLALNGVGTTNAVVVDEGRTVPIINGVLTDTFASETDVHIYRLDVPGPPDPTSTTVPGSSTIPTTTVPVTATPDYPGVVATTPRRILDTRTQSSQLSATGVTKVSVRGAGMLPSDAVSAVVNVVAASPTGPGFLTAYACDQPRPTTSFLNYQRGETRAATVRVPIAADGTICIYVHAKTDLVIDMSGYVSPMATATKLQPITAIRALDTRETVPLVPNQTRRVELATLAGLTTQTSAIDLTLTAVGRRDGGWIRAYPCGSAVPTSSTVNFASQAIVPNSTILALDNTRAICLQSNVEVDAIIDVSGYYGPESTGLVALPTQTRRLADTRTTYPLERGRSLRLSVGSANAVAVEGTVTGPDAKLGGFMTIYSCSSRRPLASNLNFTAGSIVANRFISPVSSSGDICIYTSNLSQLVVDITQIYGPAS